jgi:glycosyltransferase involved in cell wall biosynthesis
MTLWFDVEDLIAYFHVASRPTGIQRLTFEIYRELWQSEGGAGVLGFCHHGQAPTEFFAVDWPVLEAGILALNQSPIADNPHSPTSKLVRTEHGANKWTSKFASACRIPLTFRLPMGVIYRSQLQVFGACKHLVKATFTSIMALSAPAPRISTRSVRFPGIPIEFSRDDVFVALGASWGQANYSAGPALRELCNVRFALLIHDLVPELFPEWTSREGLADFQTWLREVVPQADKIFAVSRSSANDLMRHMAYLGVDIPTPIVLPIGHRPCIVDQSAKNFPKKPPETPFVLFVATIEVRKNHILLFRVWRKMLETMPIGEVPDLVFAGKAGWLTTDFMVQMENTNWLNGKMKWIESPAEVELVSLYKTCLFTAFPSLYEGWGLPVTESLSFGKIVAASNRASIPEAGGEFCIYFDPENVDEAYRVIRGMVEHPEQIAALEADIEERFHSPAWSETAAVLMDSLLTLRQASENLHPARISKLTVAA